CCVLLCLLFGRPLTLTLFPYTTLFRSFSGSRMPDGWNCTSSGSRSRAPASTARRNESPVFSSRREEVRRQIRLCPPAARITASRSEEHTSELQSRENLVCRLLLEKKKE